MKATLVIRQHGLKARLEEPPEFLKRMNLLSMKMTQARRTKKSKVSAQGGVGGMRKLSKIIQEHAERHLEVLAERWKSTSLSQGEVKQIQKRMEGVLEKLPAAIKQDERIIGESGVITDWELVFGNVKADTKMLDGAWSGWPLTFR